MYLHLSSAYSLAFLKLIKHLRVVFWYSPKKIKQSVTGNGNASKEQVSAMLMTLLNFKEKPEFLDASDALAAAVCHHFQRKPGTSSKSYTGWKAFLADNPNKKG